MPVCLQRMPIRWEHALVLASDSQEKRGAKQDVSGLRPAGCMLEKCTCLIEDELHMRC